MCPPFWIRLRNIKSTQMGVGHGVCVCYGCVSLVYLTETGDCEFNVFVYIQNREKISEQINHG